MKKRFLLMFSLLTIGTISSCGQTTSAPSFITVAPEFVTGIEIAGPTSVGIGKEITLVVDVEGSELDLVTWKSEDTSIATVNDEGKVLGISEGIVNIIATSVENTNFSKAYTINVVAPKMTDFSIRIEEDENVSLNSQTNTYDVGLGHTFYVKLDFPINTKKPDGISYEVVFSEGVETSNVVTVEITEEDSTRAKVKTYQALQNVAIKATCTYKDGATGSIINSVYFNVIDDNEENRQQVNEIFEQIGNKEKTSLSSAKITRKTSNTFVEYNENTKQINNTIINEELTYSSFNNSSYVKKITKDLSNGEDINSVTSYLYSGIDSEYNKYYLFEYDKDGLITELYQNNTASTYIENASAFVNLVNTKTYGFGSMFNAFLNQTSVLFDNILGLGSLYSYANAEFKILTNKIVITSSYIDEDTNGKYDISFTLNYEDQKIIDYEFVETIDFGDNKTVYEEKGSNFIYLEKKLEDNVDNNALYLNINDYYFTSFDLIELAGTSDEGVYDYTNLDKYGSDIVTEVDGITRYTLAYDKVLVLKISDSVPNKASVAIDLITAKSSDVNQIPDVSNAGEGIFTISPLKDDNSLAQPGEATFTFKSTKGFEKQIIVNFVEAPLKEIIISEIDNNDFGSIFQYKISDYFFINTDPDEDKYSFGIEIIEGEKDGLELYDWEKGNLEGNPEFAYSIKGLKVGTYRFRFYVKDFESICSDEYTIVVEEPYSAEYIKSQILNEKYIYDTTTVSFEVEFISETQFNFTYSNYGSPNTVNINYRIEKGNIVVDKDVTLINVYFTHLQAGEIRFNKDFSNIYLPLAYSEFEGKPFYTLYEFKKYVDPNVLVQDLTSYITNKTFKNDEASIYIYEENSSKWIDIDLSFTATTGKMEITYSSDFSTIKLATITFDYYYDKNSTSLELSNVITSNKNYNIKQSSNGYFDQYNMELEFYITDKYGDNKINFAL